MIREEGDKQQVFGKTAGYAIGFLVFTSVLFFLLTFIGKIPASWTILHVAGITASISLAGELVRRMLQ